MTSSFTPGIVLKNTMKISIDHEEVRGTITVLENMSYYKRLKALNQLTYQSKS